MGSESKFGSAKVLRIESADRQYDVGLSYPHNATLIAAAPELLEALKSALETLRDLTDDDGYLGGLEAGCLAVIAKAEGRE